jgi:hypothetical protein
VWSTEGTAVQVVLQYCRNAEVVKPCCMVVGFELINSYKTARYEILSTLSDNTGPVIYDAVSLGVFLAIVSRNELPAS